MCHFKQCPIIQYNWPILLCHVSEDDVIEVHATVYTTYVLASYYSTLLYNYWAAYATRSKPSNLTFYLHQFATYIYVRASVCISSTLQVLLLCRCLLNSGSSGQYIANNHKHSREKATGDPGDASNHDSNFNVEAGFFRGIAGILIVSRVIMAPHLQLIKE